jgi:hypothetical protein
MKTSFLPTTTHRARLEAAGSGFVVPACVLGIDRTNEPQAAA